MIEQDTVRLLRECNAGIKMGVAAIDDVMPKVQDGKLRTALKQSREKHAELGSDTHAMLERFGDDTKPPHAMAKMMAHIKTEARLAAEPTDSAVAGLITDGCNMGVKSLSKYLNEYEAADEQSKDIAKRLISLEDKLADEMRGFL